MPYLPNKSIALSIKNQEAGMSAFSTFCLFKLFGSKNSPLELIQLPINRKCDFLPG